MQKVIPRLLALLLVLAVVASFAFSADARSPVWRPRPEPPAFRVELEDERGNPLPTFRHQGRLFVLGTPGERYNVRVVNPTAERVEAVISVDGRDAVSGRVADFTTQRGYLIPAFGSVVIEGFRRSLDEVAAFRFTDRQNSYSARRGTPENVGVIGVAFFTERKRRNVVIAPKRARPEAEAAPADGAPGAAQSPAKRKSAESRGGRDNLGTEFGERRHSAVTEVAFERQDPTRPAHVATLRYDDARGLSARGIDLSSLERRLVREPREPVAFPVSRFAEPPAN